MAKGIIAGTGTVTFFNPSDNSIMATSKTLIDSGINMAITAEEARAGQGNMLLGQYFHDSSFGLTLTDQIWDLKYLAMNCGGQISAGSDVITTEQVVVENGSNGGTITVSNSPQLFGGSKIGWYKLSNQPDDAYKLFSFGTGKKSEDISALNEGDVVCVKYFYNDPSATKFVVSADYIPSIVHAILTINLFKAGVTSETLTSSSKIGEIVVDIPNFQLGGAQDLSLTSSGIASVALSGNALATFDGVATCDGNGYYAIITEKIFGKSEWDDVIALVIANSDIELSGNESETLQVYKMFGNGVQPSLVDNTKLTFTGTSGISITPKGVVSATQSGTLEVVPKTSGTGLSASAVVTHS